MRNEGRRINAEGSEGREERRAREKLVKFELVESVMHIWVLAPLK